MPQMFEYARDFCHILELTTLMAQILFVFFLHMQPLYVAVLRTDAILTCQSWLETNLNRFNKIRD